jgi:hypothetical protein
MILMMHVSMLAMLKENPALVKDIARKGQELVRERHTLGARVLPFVESIKTDRDKTGADPAKATFSMACIFRGLRLRS